MAPATHSSVERDSPVRVGIFDRVVVGVDGSEAGFEACRQAARLAEPGSTIELVAVAHLSGAIRAGPDSREVADELRRDAERALAEAVRIVGDRAVQRFVNGFATDALLREVEATHATALAIGSHGHRRTTEILIGGVAGELLHSAPCAVLVARTPAPGTAFPRSIIVGVDGSPGAERALAAGEQLAERFGVPIRAVVALRSPTVDRDRALSHAPFADEVDEHPVEALVDAAGEAGILVVGSRGLRGLGALGSVSERVAHRAPCSVLVIRPEREG
jgi:nucleotide-binding universal stress UspA family protein